MRKLSLFSGILGDDLASEWAGIKTICCVEIDPFCQVVIKKHKPDMPIIGDIRDVTRAKIKELTGIDWVNVISGGFPCQDVSIAGKREGLNGKRSTLWQEYYRLICEIKPDWIVAENVRGLLSINNGQFFGGILRDLSRCGYNAEWRVLQASWFGIPQDRERVFVVAYPSRISPPKIFHQNTIYATSYSKRVDVKSGDTTNIDYQDYRACPLPVLGDYIRSTIPNRERSGTDDGIPDRMDRYRAIGNSCCPQQVYPIYKAIMTIEQGFT